MKIKYWKILAKIAALPGISDSIIWYSKHNPYHNLVGYMNRGWIWNAFDPETDIPKYPDQYSVRVHHILREDLDPDEHNHPWPAKSMIMKGWYYEQRTVNGVTTVYLRKAGDLVELEPDTFHKILEVSPGGVHTLFFTGKRVQQWGFRVREVANTHVGFVEYERFVPAYEYNSPSGRFA